MRIPFIDDTESEQRPNAKATQYLKATLAAFGPGEAINMTQSTWAKLHEAMSVLIEQPAQPQQESVAWMPIETAPQDGTKILGWNEKFGARETQMTFYGEGSPGFAVWKSGKGPKESGWNWSEPKSNWSHTWKPTHWKPLLTPLNTTPPAAPVQEPWEPHDTAHRPGGLPQDFIKHEVENEGDWSEWVNPKPEQYFMKCCDCGLVHEMQFKVAKYSEGDECEFVADADLQAVFRARRTAPPAPVQEPVAYINQNGVIHEAGYEWAPANTLTALYTTPPAQEFVCSTGLCHYKPAAQPAPSQYGSPELQAMIVARAIEKDRAAQRQWVGLTPEETLEEAHKEEQVSGFIHGASWATFKLKEKNAAQRPWVGLTDAEIDSVQRQYIQQMMPGSRHFARSIESKLKEKNNG
jgi:hypothetical protein